MTSRTASLVTDTDFQAHEDGTLDAHITDSWFHSFGLLGGYVSGIALRASALAHGQGEALRPASIAVHYLAKPEVGPVRGRTEVVRNGRTAAYVRADLLQERTTLTAMTLFHRVADGPTIGVTGAGVPGCLGPRESTPLPVACRPYPDGTTSLYGRALELRIPEDDLAAWDVRPDTTLDTWMRFREGGWDADSALRASAMCALVDLAMLPAARRGFTEAWVVPSLDLHVQFHGIDRAIADEGEWFHVRSHAPEAAGGTVSGTAEVRTEGGRLLATAMQQMTALPPVR